MVSHGREREPVGIIISELHVVIRAVEAGRPKPPQSFWGVDAGRWSPKRAHRVPHVLHDTLLHQRQGASTKLASIARGRVRTVA